MVAKSRFQDDAELVLCQITICNGRKAVLGVDPHLLLQIRCACNSPNDHTIPSGRIFASQEGSLEPMR